MGNGNRDRVRGRGGPPRQRNHLAEVKSRTNNRPGAGLDTLYGQLLRRMPAEEVGDPNTRFGVMIPTGVKAAALRVPRRVRDVLRIDVYAVSDDGQVERLAD
jgi:hypothetical protein